MSPCGKQRALPSPFTSQMANLCQPPRLSTKKETMPWLGAWASQYCKDLSCFLFLWAKLRACPAVSTAWAAWLVDHCYCHYISKTVMCRSCAQLKLCCCNTACSKRVSTSNRFLLIVLTQTGSVQISIAYIYNMIDHHHYKSSCRS